MGGLCLQGLLYMTGFSRGYVHKVWLDIAGFARRSTGLVRVGIVPECLGG